MADQFFSQSKCSRCPNDLNVRIMSWFNEDTICMACSAKETEIKEKLKFLGLDPRDYEGCGYIPSVKECDNCNGYGSSLKENANKCTKCSGTGLLMEDK